MTIDLSVARGAADTIKNETAQNANTSARVGDAFHKMIDLSEILGGDLQPWSANTAYKKGAVIVAPSGAVIRANADRPATVSAMGATEAANWTRLGQLEGLATMVAEVFYFVGDRIKSPTGCHLLTTVAGTYQSITPASVGTFEFQGQDYIKAWAAGDYLHQNQEIYVEGNIWRSKSTRTTGANWDATEKGNFDVVTQGRGLSAPVAADNLDIASLDWSTAQHLVVTPNSDNPLNFTAAGIRPGGHVTLLVDNTRTVEIDVVLPSEIKNPDGTDMGTVKLAAGAELALSLVGNAAGNALISIGSSSGGSTALAFVSTGTIPAMAAVNTHYAFTLGAAGSISVPKGASGDKLRITDVFANAGTNPLTIKIGTSTSVPKPFLHGASDDYVLDVDRGSVEFTYANDTLGWLITSIS